MADALANSSKFPRTPWWLLEPIQNRAFAETHILPKLRPHQKLMVVPGFCALRCLPAPLRWYGSAHKFGRVAQMGMIQARTRSKRPRTGGC